MIKNIFLCLALALMLAACSDNGSADDSQNNTSSTVPAPDSAAHARDSSNPTLEGSGTGSPNTVNNAGNNGPGAGSSRDSVSKGRSK